MAEQPGFRLLVVGYDQTGITFLNRLFNGLTESGVRVILATQNAREVRKAFDGQIGCLKLSPIKDNPLRQAVNFLRLAMRVILSNKRRWLKKLVWQGVDMKEKLGRFFRYAPFCSVDFEMIYFPWNSVSITYQKLFDLEIPAVISCRGSQINIRPQMPGRKNYVDGLRMTLQRAAVVHCVSEDIQREAQKYGLDVDKSRVIRPAVDPDIFYPFEVPLQNERFKLITTGSLIWVKGYEYLLTAFKQLVEGGVDAELHILGQGYMDQNIRFTAMELGLENRVQLHGRVKPEEVLAQLQQADAFVLSSLSEGISNAVLEGMSCGLPIVTTDCGGMREAVTDGIEGYVVPVRVPDAMARALVKLAGDPELRTRIGEAGRRRVIDEFNLADQVREFLSLFEAVLNA